MIAAIALGSNLPSPFGSPADNLREALRRMSALGNVKAVSSFHTTAPVGYLDQPEFVNAAALLETTLSPLDLLPTELSRNRTSHGLTATAPLYHRMLHPKGRASSTSTCCCMTTSSSPLPRLRCLTPPCYERQLCSRATR